MRLMGAEECGLLREGTGLCGFLANWLAFAGGFLRAGRRPPFLWLPVCAEAAPRCSPTVWGGWFFAGCGWLLRVLRVGFCGRVGDRRYYAGVVGAIQSMQNHVKYVKES